jgi:hypothetical protein
VNVEPDAVAGERDALAFQAHALLEAVCPGQKDAAAGSNDAVPGQRVAGIAQGPDNLARGSGKSSGLGHLAIGGDLAARDAGDGAADELEHGTKTSKSQPGPGLPFEAGGRSGA